ncbi:MAG: hypothetical protein LBC68_07670 [Prevotellaceae bacterium]|jgi:chromatin segregation and condensation protein Rec8/ScpA/Scc1 (kleisin family)|nr:hypothetical protein [Prevotellaceae bacterium]
MDKNKIDTQTVYEMFEELNKKLDKKTERPVGPVQVDLSAVDTMTEKLENVIEEVRKSTKVEHQHRHTIGIASNWFFFSWVTLVIIILGLFGAIASQRQTISQYRNNALKYRSIKMQG